MDPNEYSTIGSDVQPYLRGESLRGRVRSRRMPCSSIVSDIEWNGCSDDLVSAERSVRTRRRNLKRLWPIEQWPGRPAGGSAQRAIPRRSRGLPLTAGRSWSPDIRPCSDLFPSSLESLNHWLLGSCLPDVNKVILGATEGSTVTSPPSLCIDVS